MAIFAPKQLPKPSIFFFLFHYIKASRGIFPKLFLSLFSRMLCSCSWSMFFLLNKDVCMSICLKLHLFFWAFIGLIFFFLFFFFKVIASLIFMHLWYPCVLYVQIPILMSIFVCPPSIHVMWGLYVCRVVKIMIWILQSYDFMIPPAQNDLDLSRIFAIVQDRYDRTILTISNDFGF